MKMDLLQKEKELFFNYCEENCPEILKRSEILSIKENLNLSNVRWLFKEPSRKAGHGLYYVHPMNEQHPTKTDDTTKEETTQITEETKPTSPKFETTQTTQTTKTTKISEDVNVIKIPEENKNYVPFGNFNDIKKLINSDNFLPILITGESGNGKTEMIEQICAKTKKPFVRINCSVETDETDFIGHYQLIDGNTVWHDSSLISAMKQGAIILIDEIFSALPSKLFSIQSIMEGKPFQNKKTGETVHPKPGFNIIATDNTKGQGDESGRYLGTNLQNSALLERFPICIEHTYPNAKTEKTILNKLMKSLSVEDENFTECLTTWANTTRATYYEGGMDELITTRRLCQIVKTFSVFEDRKKSIQFCLNRFDENTKEAFWSLYEKIDVSVVPEHKRNQSDQNYNFYLTQRKIEYFVEINRNWISQPLEISVLPDLQSEEPPLILNKEKYEISEMTGEDSITTSNPNNVFVKILFDNETIENAFETFGHRQLMAKIIQDINV